MRRLLPLMLVLTGLACAAPDYSVAGIDDASQPPKFLHTLQAAVAANQPATVAKLVHYPLRVNHDSKSSLIASPEAFVKAYPQVFTADVRKSLAEQKGNDLFVNYQGVMVGGGQIWFGPQSDKSLKIITINN